MNTDTREEAKGAEGGSGFQLATSRSHDSSQENESNYNVYDVVGGGGVSVSGFSRFVQTFSLAHPRCFVLLK